MDWPLINMSININGIILTAHCYLLYYFNSIIFFPSSYTIIEQLLCPLFML